MSVVKSLSVGDGDMFYIQHNTDNFSIIDCCMEDGNRAAIVDELTRERGDRHITRFISTHPDDDHIRGLVYLDDRLEILNFYCVKNSATKDEETDDFTRYCTLRDSEKKAFYIHKGCTRRWMNQDSDERKSSGINILWPDTNNEYYEAALEEAALGLSPNNISPIISYSVAGGATILWMGDLETEFMNDIADELALPHVDILFAPHHGRDSGKVPQSLLDRMTPKLIVIGEAPSGQLNYYAGHDTLTQNSAGDIAFDCQAGIVHVYVSSIAYTVDFLENRRIGYSISHGYYLGTLIL